MMSFSDRVRAVVRDIPPGQTRSYKEVAIAAGSPRAYRTVASIMATNFDPSIPCHRVIKNNGELGGYNRGGILQKRSLLIKEGYLSNYV